MTASSAASQRAALIERFTAPGQPFESGKVLKRDLRSAIASELRDG